MVLGVADAQAFRLAMEQVKTNVARHAPLPVDFELMVQPMVKGLAEVLLGFKRDVDAGAIVMLAVGDGVIKAEVNPVMVLPQGQGVCAVDALVLARVAPEHG